MMKIFNQNKCSFIAIEVPEGADEFEILYHANILTHKEGGVDLWYGLPPDMGDLKSLPQAEYSIIGLLPEITEEQAKEMVACDDRGNGIKLYGYYFKEGAFGEECQLELESAIDSLKSRLRSLGFTNENILIIKQLT